MKTKSAVAAQGIAYDDVGSGSPPVVLIHGAFGNRSHYAAQIDHLKESHRVIALDLRGHGESGRPDSGFRLRDFADDVIGVCEAAGLDRYVLCGHSMPVALLAASLHPERVAGVVLLDGVILYPETLRSHVVSDFVPKLAGDGWAEAMQGYLVGRGIGPYDSPVLKARILEEIASGPPGMAAPFMRDLMATDFSELLTGDYPLMYVHARVPADLARLRELRPDVILACVAASGHWMMLSVPDQVNSMLDRLLEIVESCPAAVSRAQTMNTRANLPGYALRPGEGTTLIPGRVLLRVPAQKTEGAFEVIELAGPEGDGPPPHIHRDHQELFYVLQGRAEFTIGDDPIAAEAGSLVFVPRNTRHGFKLGPDCKLLGFVAPAGLEGFFKELGAGMAAGKSQAEIRQVLDAKYDSHPA